MPKILLILDSIFDHGAHDCVMVSMVLCFQAVTPGGATTGALAELRITI